MVPSKFGVHSTVPWPSSESSSSEKQRQARLGITHGGEGWGSSGAPPVALTVHQRVAVGEGLNHQHHGFVTGDVAVG